MHFNRTIVLAAVAAAALFAQPAADAEAGHRWHLQFGWPFADGYYAPRHRYYYEREYYDPYYEDDGVYSYDPYYYEPPPRRKKRAQRYYDDEQFYDEPPPKKKKKLSTAKAYPEPYVEQPAPKKRPRQTAAVAPTNKPAPNVRKETASGPVTCDKAKAIIGGYGFANVTPTDCEGSELGFKALRDGKSFSIKVSSLSGELTEVKRQ